MTQSALPKTTILPRRAKALAYLRYGGLDPLYRRFPQSARTVALALQRGVLQPDLAQALQQELGPSGWAFLTGAVNTLADEVADHAAA